MATKPKFVSDILEKGFSKEEVETQINALKEEGAIVYSKIKPAGWSLAAEGGIKPTVEPKVGAPKVKAAPKAKAAPGKKAPKAKPAPKPKAAPESEQAKALETQTKIAEAGIKPAIELKVEVPKVKAAPKTKAVPGKKAPKAKPAPKPKAAPENEQATALETPSKIGKTAGEGASSRSKPPLKATIIEYLKGAKLVTTKPKFVADIVEKGYSKEEVEEQINSLKDEGLIAYSRTKPVGWSLSENSA